MGALPRQLARSHQECIDSLRRLAAFADRPDDKRLAPPHVAAGKHLGLRGLVAHLAGQDVAAQIKRHAKSFQQSLMHRRDKTRGEKDEIGPELEGAVWNLL